MANHGPGNDRRQAYLIVGGCALLALTVTSVSTLAFVGMGRDTPPQSGTRPTQQTTIRTNPAAHPASTAQSAPTAHSAPTPTLLTISRALSTPSGSAGQSARVASQSGDSRSSELRSGEPRGPSIAGAEPTPGPTGSQEARLARSGVTNYQVVSGDTLERIGSRFGVSVQTLVAVNALSRPEALKVGQELEIPAVDGRVHRVEAGETVTRIAARYGVSTEAIAQHNGLGETYAIKVGQVLMIPGAAPVTAAASTPGPAAPIATVTAAASRPTGAATPPATKKPAAPTKVSGQPAGGP